MAEQATTELGLRIAREALAAIQVHAVGGYPREVVGVLAGNRRDGTIDRAVPLVNEHPDDPEHRHHVGADTVVRVEAELAAAGFDVLGHYHSHPDHPACPSETDRCRAWPNLVYVIVAVGPTGLVDTRAWRLSAARTAMVPVPLTLS